MIDKNIIEAHGCSADEWKKLLVLPEPEPEPVAGKGKKKKKEEPPKEPTEQEKKISDLRERIRSRLTNGRDQNTKNFRTIRALDLIWDTPYQAITPTLLTNISKTCKTTEEVNSALKMYDLDLDACWTTTPGELDPKTGQPVRKLNIPMFVQMTIPLVRGMLGIRRAKLFNDRNKDPFLHYPPAVSSQQNRILCSVVQSRARTMSQQYNYPELLNQALFHELLYSNCLVFTQEAWHYEEQLRVKKDSRKKSKKTKGDYETYTDKEGLRYFIPHPARTFFDRSHPVKTFNTDTGCDWGGHWRILQYKDLKKNKEFYNVDKIATGDLSWWSSNATFLNTFFSSCVVNAPTTPAMPPTIDGSVQNKTQDREAWIDRTSFYGPTDDDKSLCLFEYRERLIPKDEGLGSYPHRIWARFVCAGDGTIVYAEPLTYPAIRVLKDNGDEKRMEDASMALMLTPFQDHLTNLMTQYILAVKQNLANLTLFDKNVIDADSMEKVKNLGESWYRSLNLQEIDSKKAKAGRDNIPNAIISHRFPQLNTSEILQAARTVIDLAERVLQFSSQEVGQAASHEQSKAEVVQLGDTTSNTLAYIGYSVDSFLGAMGIQVYEAWVNEGDDEFTAEIPYDESVDKAILKELGFEFVEEPKPLAGKAHIKGKKSKLPMDLLMFSAIPNSAERKTDEQMARVLSEFTRDLLSGPYAPAVGADQAIALYNAIAKFAGLPMEAPLRNTGMTPEKQAEESKKQLSQLVEQVKKQFGQEVEQRVLGEVKQGLVPMMEHDKMVDGAVRSVGQKVDLLWQMLKLPPINGNGSQVPVGGAPAPAPAAGPTA